jgi:hypothetical protein
MYRTSRARRVSTVWLLAALGAALGGAAACDASDASGASGERSGEGVDEQNAWKAPAEGSCDASAMVSVANRASFQELDVDARLERRAAENIVANRPYQTLGELDAVPRVGPATMAALFRYAKTLGQLAGCGLELGLVSDLDKTVIPASTPDLAKAPYPGVRSLYRALEHRNGGAAGDVYYVTARTPEKVTDVPAYLASHDVPGGPIETGISGVPWIAEPEKVRDISAILEGTGSQRFVLFGDTDHRDPEAYKKVVDTYPDRIVAGIIHKVNRTVAPERVEGLYLVESYAEAAAVLHGLAALSRDEALAIMHDAREEGLAITDDEMQALLDAHAP